MKIKIMVIEDDKNVRRLIVDLMNCSGYKTMAFERAGDALKKLKTVRPDVVLLDLILPGLSGIDFCKIIRSDEKYKDLPIIMITAKDSDREKVLGLEVGADDYITKPFNDAELKARIKALLRRIKGGLLSDNVLTSGPLVLNVDQHKVTVNGKEVNLRLREFDLLYFLMREKDKLVSWEAIVKEVLGHDYYIQSACKKDIAVHMMNLRSKLGKAAKMIETVRGVGYRFNFVE